MENCTNIEDYLEYVGRFRQNDFGRQFRTQFRDTRGTAELAMLASPSQSEFDDFRRTVQAMTEQEKSAPEELTDQQIADLARRTGADPGHVNIFINGYILARKNAAVTVKNKTDM